jgi:DNA-binding NtrC family response regulator
MLTTSKTQNRRFPPAQTVRACEGLVLVADDEVIARELCCHHLESAGLRAISACDGQQALEMLTPEVDVVLVDLAIPRLHETEWLAEIREINPSVQVIAIAGLTQQTDFRDSNPNAAALLHKPFEPDELLQRVAEGVRVTRQNRQSSAKRTFRADDIVATSQASQDLLQRVERIAGSDATLLITGASGTGQSKIARLIHENSFRNDKPFVALNCASLPRELMESELFGHTRGSFTGAIENRIGKIEAANGGTLFLDEIGDLPIELQPKLLTFIQDRCFQRIGSNTNQTADVRVVAATHQDLAGMCARREFREDLLFRLNVLTLRMPTLSQRSEDIPDLAARFLDRIADQYGTPRKTLDASAVLRLKSHAWTGNVRELENVLERAVAFSNYAVIASEDLELRQADDSATNVAAGSDGVILAGKTLAEIEQLAIVQTLESTGGNKAMAARILGNSEKSIYNKMKRFKDAT